MSAYTPGPWQVSSWYSKAGRSCSVSNGLQGVAAVYGIGRQESEANARLIAASPELIELVVRCEGWLTSAETAEIASGTRTYHSKFLDDLRAAIDKALGEQA